MILYDHGYDGKKIGTILEDLDVITLGHNDGPDMGPLDGKFDWCNDGKLEG